MPQQKATAMSSTRQQTLLRDRIRSRAVSRYLADLRSTLVDTLSDEVKKDKNKKRKELERLARERFTKESDIVQKRYLDMVMRPEPLPAEVGEQEAEFRSSGDVLRSSEASSIASSSASAAAPLVSKPASSSQRTPSPCAHLSDNSPPKRSKLVGAPQGQSSGATVGGLDIQWSIGRSTVLHDQLVRQCKPLRDLYGDAGALEALASGVRILDAIDMGAWPNRAGVKVAVVAGMAAKMTQASTDDQHVRKLWAKLAGQSSETEVRRLDNTNVQHLG